MATKMEPSSINSCWINKGSQIWMSSWNSQFSPGWYFVQKPAMLIPALCSSPFKKSRNLCHLNMVSLKIKWPPGSMPSAFSSQLVRNLGLLPPSTFPWNHKTKKPFMLPDKQENKITEAIKKRTMNQQVKTETSRIMRRVKLGPGHWHTGLSHSLIVKDQRKNRSSSWTTERWGWREATEARPWFSGDAQSPAGKYL